MKVVRLYKSPDGKYYDRPDKEMQESNLCFNSETKGVYVNFTVPENKYSGFTKLFGTKIIFPYVLEGKFYCFHEGQLVPVV